VNLSADDAELVQLLGQLLRVVSPESAGPGTGEPGSRTPHRVAGEPAEPPIPALSASEARALIELVAARGIAQGQLGTLLGLEKSTVSRLAAGLERKGWVRRGRDEANQRYIRLYLTPEGSRVAARVWSAWQTRQARILAELTIEERAGLASGLRGLIRGLAAEGLVADVPPPGDGPVPGDAAADGAAAGSAASAPVHRG
jgi:DNA-binding MarR family transcriptional regulator